MGSGKRDGVEEWARREVARLNGQDPDALELTGAELVAEHTGLTCGAERPSGAWEGRTYVCVEPVGHGGPHRDPRFSAEWFDGLTTVLDPFRVGMTRDPYTTTAPEREA
jgi:hypothetical protein